MRNGTSPCARGGGAGVQCARAHARWRRDCRCGEGRRWRRRRGGDARARPLVPPLPPREEQQQEEAAPSRRGAPGEAGRATGPGKENAARLRVRRARLRCGGAPLKFDRAGGARERHGRPWAARAGRGRSRGSAGPGDPLCHRGWSPARLAPGHPRARPRCPGPGRALGAGSRPSRARLVSFPPIIYHCGEYELVDEELSAASGPLPAPTRSGHRGDPRSTPAGVKRSHRRAGNHRLTES
ncbi:uncharacterized protein C10orf95-like [Cuculus canorus]|uniref:uncharacterized protein C10orf95-like n=1 Tax=Cuculus canorus TaxID=55661 RepID=UPI0023AAFBC0|nr:uncharacterized protein C10orf95-like [Cuculus canorus]